jgi:hypothetical protein
MTNPFLSTTTRWSRYGAWRAALPFLPPSSQIPMRLSRAARRASCRGTSARRAELGMVAQISSMVEPPLVLTDGGETGRRRGAVAEPWWRGTRPLCCGRHWRGRTGRHVEERPKVKAMETIQRFEYPPLEISLEPVSKVVLHLYFGRRNHTIHLSNGSHIPPHKMSNTLERTLFSRVLSPPLSCSLVLGYHVACVGALGCGWPEWLCVAAESPSASKGKLLEINAPPSVGFMCLLSETAGESLLCWKHILCIGTYRIYIVHMK